MVVLIQQIASCCFPSKHTDLFGSQPYLRARNIGKARCPQNGLPLHTHRARTLTLLDFGKAVFGGLLVEGQPAPWTAVLSEVSSRETLAAKSQRMSKT